MIPRGGRRRAAGGGGFDLSIRGQNHSRAVPPFLFSPFYLMRRLKKEAEQSNLGLLGRGRV